MVGRSFCAVLAGALLLAGCHRGGRSGGPDARDAWVRLPAAAGRPAAAYFTLRGGSKPERLAGIESPSVQRAELHQGGMTDGMMTMRPMNGIDLPAGGRVAFAPGGDHVMLFGVDPLLKAGGTMTLKFRFHDGAALEAQAKIVGAGDPAPAF